MIPASWAAAPNCAMELPSGDDEELLLLSDDDGTTLELPSCDDGAHPGGASSSQGIAKRKAAPFAESPHLRGRQRTLAIATGIGAGRKPSSSNLRRGSHTARRELMQGSACNGSASGQGARGVVPRDCVCCGNILVGGTHECDTCRLRPLCAACFTPEEHNCPGWPVFAAEFAALEEDGGLPSVGDGCSDAGSS